MEYNETDNEEKVVPTPKGRTKKMKGIPYQELVAMREQRRLERRQKHKHRPQTHYKGLTWHVRQSGVGAWHVQVWTGKTVRPYLGALLLRTNLPSLVRCSASRGSPFMLEG